MKNLSLNLMGGQLTRSQMRSINGGNFISPGDDDGSCQSWVGGQHFTGLSVEDAQGDYQFCVENNLGNCRYCCASC